MSEVGKHNSSIEQRRDVYIAACGCGWRGPRTRVLRDAEADAWHHQFGDGRLIVVDMESVAPREALRAPRTPAPAHASGPGGPGGPGGPSMASGADARREPSPPSPAPNQPSAVNDDDAEIVGRLVSRARELARSSSPHRPGVTRELQAMAQGSISRLEKARATIVELLHKHDQVSQGAADSQWLELHTAKRIIDAAADRHTAPAI